MSQKFQAAIHQRDDVCFVKLSGVIDEDNDLADLGAKLGGGTTVIDLGEVERINSCGVRDWVNWLSGIEAKGAEVILVECSPAIVAQINLVNNFTGQGVVKSFYIPYFCPECDEEKVLLADVADMGDAPYEPPVCRCDDCDLVMDFDDMPDSYFAFLASQKGRSTADNIQSVLSEFQSFPEEDSRIRSRIGQGGSEHSTGHGNNAGASLPSVPALPTMSPSASQGASRSPQASVKSASSNPIVFVLVAVLVLSIGVLGFLVLK